MNVAALSALCPGVRHLLAALIAGIALVTLCGPTVVAGKARAVDVMRLLEALGPARLPASRSRCGMRRTGLESHAGRPYLAPPRAEP